MTNTINKGDRFKVKLPGSTFNGMTGTVTELIGSFSWKDCGFHATLDGLDKPALLFRSEVEITGTDNIGGFKVGDKVGFNYNDHWDDGEAEVISLKPGAHFGIEIELTKSPSKNNLQKVGYTSHWDAVSLKHLPEEAKQIDGFKVGDMVGFENWNEVWADGEGVVTKLDESRRGGLNIKVKLTQQPSRNPSYAVGSESYWSAKHLNHLEEATKPEPKFKVGDKVAIASNDSYLSGAEGEVINFSDEYGYHVKLTKANPMNLLVTQGSKIWFTEAKLSAVQEPKTLDANKLIIKPLGTVVSDKEGRAWVLVGQQHYAHKGWDGLESIHAASLVKKYGPITERVK